MFSGPRTNRASDGKKVLGNVSSEVVRFAGKVREVAKVPVFISFDYDNDNDLKILLVGQAKNADSPFEITDHSVRIASPD